MSYTIEYKRLLYYIPAGDPWFEDETYAQFTECGDNNVWDDGTPYRRSRRARDWYNTMTGTLEEFQALLDIDAEHCRKGNIQAARGMYGTEYFDPDYYRKLYEREFRKKRPLNMMLEIFSLNLHIQGNPNLTDIAQDKTAKEISALNQLIYDSGVEPQLRGRRYEDVRAEVYNIPVTADNLTLALYVRQHYKKDYHALLDINPIYAYYGKSANQIYRTGLAPQRQIDRYAARSNNVRND